MLQLCKGFKSRQKTLVAGQDTQKAEHQQQHVCWCGVFMSDIVGSPQAGLTWANKVAAL